MMISYQLHSMLKKVPDHILFLAHLSFAQGELL